MRYVILILSCLTRADLGVRKGNVILKKDVAVMGEATIECGRVRWVGCTGHTLYTLSPYVVCL
jgi:hypothetical protein